MADNMSKELEVILKFILDKTTLNNVKNGVVTVDQAFEGVYKNILRSKAALIDISEGMKKYEKTATKAFLASSVYLAGIFTFTDRYVKKLGETDPIFQKWEANSKKIEASQNRIARVSANQMLPLYEEAANITEDVAKFVEGNPEVVKAALNVGLFVAGFSALSIAVTKGIKFVADVTYIATSATQLLAAKTMERAANKQLAAGVSMAKPSGGQIAQGLRSTFGLAPAATGATSVAAVVGTTLAVIASGTIIGTIIYDLIAKKFGLTRVNEMATAGAYTAGNVIGKGAQALGMSPEEAERKSIVFAAIIGKLSGAIDENSPLWLRASESAKKATENMKEAVANLAGSEFEQQIVNAYSDMKMASKQASEDYFNAVGAIEVDYHNRSIQETERYHKTVQSIQENYQKQISSISSSYLKESKRAEEAFNKQRSDLIRDSGIEIQRLEEDLQEKLMKLRSEHEEKVENLVGKRDALGLLREMRSYEKKRKEEVDGTNKEIRRRREDLARRLEDISENYARERKMRLEEYKENLKNAKEQRDNQLKLEKEAYEKQMQSIEEAKNNELKQLQSKHQIEAQQRKDAFVAMIRDLNSALLGEKNMKTSYYTAMLEDAQRFLDAYRLKLGGIFAPSFGSSKPGAGGGVRTNKSNSGIGTRLSGGYAPKGLYALSEDGRTEFVLRGDTTRMAEEVVGARLSQENIISAIKGSGNKSIVYSPRIDSRVSKEDARKIQNSFFEAMEGFA